uniref:Uncharacterized protein n=1 Tax=Anguilla anguilla TaxID=7936 RepID=A0A0E9UXD6_ANGAN
MGICYILVQNNTKWFVFVCCVHTVLRKRQVKKPESQ